MTSNQELVKIISWNELIEHTKDRGKDDSNSRANSLQPGETDAGENQT